MVPIIQLVNGFLLSGLLFSALVYAENFRQSYHEKDAEILRFLDFKSEDYKRLAKSVFNNSNQPVYKWQYPNEFTHDANLGYRHNPLTEVRHIQRTDKELIYDAVYSFDRYSRRIVPGLTGPRKKFAVFYGCSLTYGNGLNDNETLPYFFAQKDKLYYPYNYAIGATGTNSMLALLEERRLKSEISESSGVFIYIYIQDHLARALGKLPALRWLRDTPYYRLEANRPIRDGSFERAQPLRTWMLLKLQPLLDAVGLAKSAFPPVSRFDDQSICYLIAAAKEEFTSQFPQSRFLVYNHPLSPPSPEIFRCLSENGVENLGGTLPFENSLGMIRLDGHPNARANEAIATDLARHLTQKN